MIPIEKMPEPGARLDCTDGARFEVEAVIGEGGQGRVYSLKGQAQLCAKMYFGRDASKAEPLRQRLERLRQLQATEQLVLPRKVLRSPAIGYVMDRVVEHRSIEELASMPPGQRVQSWYAETGGLRRRLLLGMELCRAFQDLHSRGLAYCDLSFGNVLVSRGPLPKVRLIDCDNLTLTGLPDAGVEGTPWFVAPEVLRGTHRPDAMTDSHSLAVLLYHLLVLSHPLIGDSIRSGPHEGEDRALRGENLDKSPLPWVDHPQDSRNRSTTGLPRALVLSSKLREAFHLAFGVGLLDRSRRPTEGTWAELLGRAVDAVQSCNLCKNHLFLPPEALKGEPMPPCPWCKQPLSTPTVLLLHTPEGLRPLVVEQRRRLYPRHMQFRRATLAEDHLLEVGLTPQGLRLENHGTEDILFDDQSRLPAEAHRLLRQGDSFRVGDRGVKVVVQRIGKRGGL